jgi:hypothetical protein
MKYKYVLLLLVLFSLGENTYSQDKLFYNRIYLYEHRECQHPIGTVISDKVYYGFNADNTSFMNFNNTEGDIAYVDLINYGKYTAYNQFLKYPFVGANIVMMGYRQSVPSISASVREARSQFRLDKVKDTILSEKRLKHIRITPKDTLIHRFQSYNILINTEAETETPLYTSPTAYFLLLGSLKDLKGTVVETYFIDLEGYIFCNDVLRGVQITNKRVILK